MKFCYTLFVSLFALFTAATAQQTIWTGAVDQNWSNPANWNNGLPAPGNSAVIPGGVVLPVQASNITINFPVQNSSTLDFSGTVVNADHFTNFSGGQVRNNADFTNNGTVSFENGGQVFNIQRFVNNGSISQFGSGQWKNEPGSFFVNSSSGAFTNNGLYTNEGNFENHGDFITGTTLENKATMTNHKTLLVGYGTGKIDNFPGASINITPAGTLDVQGLLDNRGTVENNGAFKISATGHFNNRNGATFFNKSVARNFGTTDNDGIYKNGCASCDTTNIYQYNDYGGVFRNLRIFENFGTLELMPCSEFYQNSVVGAPITGKVWLMGIVYELQGTIDENNIMGGVVLTNVADKPHPTARCKNISVTLDPQGQVSITPAQIDNGSTADYCEIATKTVTPATFSCSDVGNKTVTLTVTDAKGNSSTCQATVTVQPSAGCPGCFNVTYPGVISGNQTICSGDAPATIQNVALATGGVGEVEYIWIKWTVEPLANPNAFTMMPGTNTVSLDPGPLTQTTWFRRCARSATCLDFIAETNIVKITVVPKPNPQVVLVQPNCLVSTGRATLSNVPVGSSVSLDGGAAQIDQLVFENIAPGAHTVLVTKDGCSATLNFTIQNTVNSTPNPEINLIQPTCAVPTGSLAITNLPAGFSSKLDNGIFTLDKTTYSGIAPGQHTIAIGKDGCDKTLNFTILPLIAASPNVLCKNITVALVGSQVVITAIELDNGSTAGCGTITSYTLSQTTFTSPGTFTVVLTVTNSFGVSSTCQAQVTIYRPCDNVTNSGSIAGDQTICYGADPAAITSVSLPSGGAGTIEYVWLRYNLDPATNPNAFVQIAGANGPSYDPGPLTQTTWFRRCARREFCTDYVGESNIVKITVNNTPPTAICRNFAAVLPQAGGTINITPADIDNGSTPGYGSIVNRTVTPNTFTAPGTYSVVLTVTNTCGLSSTCTAQVIITQPIPQPTTCPNNLILNAGFEQDFANWDLWGDGQSIVNDKYEGAKAALICPGTSAGGGIGQSFSVRSGEIVNLSLFAKFGNASATWAGFGLTFYDANWNELGYSNTTTITGTTYAQFVNIGIVPQNAIHASIWIWKDFGGGVYIDNICVEKQPAPTTCLDNLFVNPSFEYNFTGYWAEGGATIEPLPRSGSWAAQICPPNSNGGGVGQSVRVSSGENLSVTVWAKKNNSSATWAGFGISWYDVNWNWLGDYNGPSVTATTYTQYSLTASAPAGAFWADVWVWKNLGGAVIVDDFCVTKTPGTAPQPNCKSVLFVTGCLPLNAGDTWAKSRIESLGFSVSVKVASQTYASDATGKGLIVISSTVLSTDLGNRLTGVNVPIVNWESQLLDDLKMTGTGYYDYGGASINSLEITAAGHPLAAGLSGTVGVYGFSNAARWGLPSASAIKVAKIPGYNQFGVFAYESGASMVGMNAPARRVHLFMDDATPASLNLNGQKLFDAAIVWAANCGNTTPQPTCNKTALFVVGCLPLSAGDNAVKNRLQALGLTVTPVLDCYVTANDAAGKGLVVISSSINSGLVNTKLTNITQPILCWEAWLYDDLKMTSTVQGTDYNTAWEYRLNILQPSHPIAAGLTGTKSIFSYANDITWGKTGTGATQIADILNQSGKSALFSYETGSQMVGATAPARRVGFFFRDNNTTCATADAWKMFDNAVKWAMNCNDLNTLALAVRQEAVTFNAFKKGADVSLKWINNTGERNDQFIVERSANGDMFEEILRLDGRGNADEILYFNELDENPLPGKNYYRLRLRFQDGMETLTETQLVTMPDVQDFEVFPNPANEKTWLDLTPFAGKKVVVTLVNQMGIPVRTLEVLEASNEPVTLDLTGIDNGFYTISIVSGAIKRSNRLIVSHTY